MAIDFPNTPATNDTYTVGTKTWIYDGTAWNTYNTTSFSAETLPGTTLKSTVTGSSLTSVGTLNSLTVTGDVTVDTNTLKVDSTNNRVGIGTASPARSLDVVGEIRTFQSSGNDSVSLYGRTGGTSSFNVMLTPDVLTGTRNLTLPNTSGTFITTGNQPAMTSNYFSFAAARITGFAVGQNFAFGNGDSTGRIPLPFACQLIYVSLAVAPAHTGTTTVQLVKNGSLVAGITQSITGTTPVITNWTASNLTFAAGDTFNWQCTAISGTLDTTNATFFFRPT